MNKGNILSCPDCGRNYTTKLNDSSLVLCQHCGKNLVNDMQHVFTPRTPDDWSFIRIGTTGEFNKQAFTILGRVRLQLRNDYKNFWSGEHASGKHFWIVESFGSICVCSSNWMEYGKDKAKLRAGVTIKLNSEHNVKGEYVEKCEGLSYEGEIGTWELFTPGFFVVQGSRNDGKTAIFAIEPKKNVLYLTGDKVTKESLNLKNIHEWNEWK